MKKRLLKTLKNDPILVVSFVLAAVSCFFVTPDREYLSYPDLRTLSILFSLMLVVGALVRIGTFDFLTERLLSRIHSERNVTLLLVLLAFFLSMILTNDVTLVTLVPFALLLLRSFGDRRRIVYTLILMTIAANLGSMLTPIGNPQNLYLYSKYGFSLSDFTLTMLPYTIGSLALLVICVFFLNRTDHTMDKASIKPAQAPPVSRLLLYSALFIVCLLTVAGVLHYGIMLGIVVVVMIPADRRAFLKVDYALLFTFLFFFILIGNLKRIDVIQNTLSTIIDANVTVTAVLSSQVISNVPAAMLLSAFTGQGKALLVGVNLGGLGTLIASMASLITFKFYAKERRPGEHYLLKFTVLNLIFLAVLLTMNLWV